MDWAEAVYEAIRAGHDTKKKAMDAIGIGEREWKRWPRKLRDNGRIYHERGKWHLSGHRSWPLA